MKPHLAFRYCVAVLVILIVACTRNGDVSPPPPPPETAVTSAEPQKNLAVAPMPMTERTRTRMDSGAMLAKPAGMAADSLPAPEPEIDRENYQHFSDNPVKQTKVEPVSTFSIDVDTGAYANMRRMLQNGRLPPQDAVRAEEFINYFSYDYPVSETQQPPFSVTTELGVTPWNANTVLLHVGLQGYKVPKSQLPASNLVFLIDVSGSMNSPDKLGLLKNALILLSGQLSAQDRVAIVVYAGAAGLVLPSTPANQTSDIKLALGQLSAGGSTNGGEGIQLAYQVAKQNFIKDGINRILLATDGDFNVGTVNFESLKDLVEREREHGVSLTTLGFGTGNYNDHLMEQLADAGNGNYAYIDTLNEAQKVLVDEMSSTFQTIAKDVKIQIEFNPAVVAEYRLIGYENRLLKREDFNNDKIDAGEIGAGHSVTALYELALIGGNGERLEALRYADNTPVTGNTNEVAFLRLRYKQPMGTESQLLEWPILRKNLITALDQTSDNFRFSAAVAAFAQQLRGGNYLEQYGYADIIALADSARSHDSFGYRGEFVRLVNLAASLSSNR